MIVQKLLALWLYITTTINTTTAISAVEGKPIHLVESNTTDVGQLCETIDFTKFATAIRSEDLDCDAKQSYDWGTKSLQLPTHAQRLRLCSCAPLIFKLQTIYIPRCTVVRSGYPYTFKELLEYGFALCDDDPTNDGEDGSDGSMPVSTPQANADSSITTSISITTTTTPKKSKVSTHTALIGGIIGGMIVLIGIVGLFAYKYGKNKKKQSVDTEYIALPIPFLSKEVTGSVTGTNTSIGTGSTLPLTSGLWNDPVIIAMRIPFHLIQWEHLLSRGGFGEVFKGYYKGQSVAIKRILPSKRGDLHQIDVFLHEIKLMAGLEHERIVRLMGVAWDSLNEMCALTEYMPKGDLRRVLIHWEEEERREHGYDYDKLKIAVHVAHALTYLHSLQPIIVHRDLKSKNILLNEEYDAKVTDFGVSRVTADQTMTAGVGSSLWMAPEVMMGEHYDEKADVFSFGVVLSELDTHVLPYSNVQEKGTGRKLPEPAVLQMVSMGRLRVSFSEQANPEVVALGMACVAVDPQERPHSAEVLHRIHQIWKRYEVEEAYTL